MATIGFLGLGNLGFPIAHNLVARGHALKAYNRTASKGEALVAEGASFVSRPVDAVEAGGVVVSLLWDDASVEEVVHADGFLEKLGHGGVHVSMTTLAPDTARRLAASHAKHGAAYVSAPVFGRPEAAVARKLWLLASGSEAAKARVRPLFDDMGAAGVHDFGVDAGAALAVKLAGNFMIFAATLGLREALAMVQGSGVDARAFLAMMTGTIFPGSIYEGYGKRLLEDPSLSFRGGIAGKDVGLFVQEAAAHDLASPLATHLHELVTGR